MREVQKLFDLSHIKSTLHFSCALYDRFYLPARSENYTEYDVQLMSFIF